MVRNDPKNTVSMIEPNREARAAKAFESITEATEVEVNVMDDLKALNNATETTQQDNTNNMNDAQAYNEVALVDEFMSAWTTGFTSATSASARAAVLLSQHKDELFITVKSKTVSRLQLMQNKNDQPGSFKVVFQSTLFNEIRALLASEGFSDIESDIAIQVFIAANIKHNITSELVKNTQGKMRSRLVLSLEYLADEPETA